MKFQFKTTNQCILHRTNDNPNVIKINPSCRPPQHPKFAVNVATILELHLLATSSVARRSRRSLLLSLICYPTIQAITFRKQKLLLEFQLRLPERESCNKRVAELALSELLSKLCMLPVLSMSFRFNLESSFPRSMKKRDFRIGRQN
jgi:hypothetical protein